MDKFEQRKKDFLKIAVELAEMFDKKNRDYNDSYFNQSSEQGFPVDKILSKVDFYVQIRRKISRIASFAEKRLKGESAKNLVEDEVEEDSICDLGIYSVMELMKRRMENEINK